MTKDFISFSESLWRDWLVGGLELSQFVRREFDLNAFPEPYVSFCCGDKPLILLTTNPGGVMNHQRRTTVQDGHGPLRPGMTYAEAAKELGSFYERKLIRRAAGRRISAAKRLSKLIGMEGVLQVEMCPFHSESLPRKSALLCEMHTDGCLLNRYAQALADFLAAKPVVALTAAPSGACLERKPLGPWESELLKTAGFDLGSMNSFPLVENGGKVTVKALVSHRSGVPKALIQMMGNNNLPGEKGLGALADALR